MPLLEQKCRHSTKLCRMIKTLIFTHLRFIKAVAITPIRERSGSVVECLTRDRRAAGSSLTGVTALWSLSKTHLS